ncbi:hypothetical protein D3C72_2475690 [compost metagenome]
MRLHNPQIEFLQIFYWSIFVEIKNWIAQLISIRVDPVQFLLEMIDHVDGCNKVLHEKCLFPGSGIGAAHQ